LTNAVIHNNTANPNSPLATRSIQMGDPSLVTISYSLVQHVTIGTINNNLNGSLDPLFVDPAADYRLQLCSPAVNRGDGSADIPGTDLDNQPRIFGGTVDLGPYELQQEKSEPAVRIPLTNRTVEVGTSLLLDGTATGSGTVNYQWLKDGQEITGARSATYRIDEVDFSDAGSYAVRLTDDCTASPVTSAAAEVTVACWAYPDGRVYVREGATGEGRSWTDAAGLQAALAAAERCGVGEIWVAAGTYRPTTNGDRYAAFVMREGVAIYGGFTGTETRLEDRDWLVNRSILSGDLSGNDGPGFTGREENSYTVVRNERTNITNAAVLDGFTISGGHADRPGGNSPGDSGGGMYNVDASPTIRNCSFSQNHSNYAGGGMANGGTSAPVITNTSFRGNRTNGGGGAMTAYSTSVDLTNCLFSGNYSAKGGGAVVAVGARVKLLNCTIAGNRTGGQGGAAVQDDFRAGLTVLNSIIYGNQSDEDGSPTTRGVFSSSTGSLTIRYSLVQGMTTGTENNNLDGSRDPLFVDPIDPGTAPSPAGNYHLRSGSPAVRAGDNGFNPMATDLDGNPRRDGGVVDLGPYQLPEAALPVELLSFTGWPKEAHNLLEWQTSLEIDVDYFALERSDDGVDFTEIGRTTALNRPSTYQLRDLRPAALQYYRLRSVDFDGTENVSDLIVVRNGETAVDLLAIFPNPTPGRMHLRGAGSEALSTDIYSASGRWLATVLGKEVDLSAYPAGIYLLLTTGEESGKVWKNRVVRQ
jgi:predicted outer membrane repeat protein